MAIQTHRVHFRNRRITAWLGVCRRAALSAFALFVTASSLPSLADAEAVRTTRSVRVLSEDQRGVRLEYRAGQARWDTISVGAERFERVRLDGAVMIEPPGRPALPTALLQIAIPDGMTPLLRVEIEEADDRPGIPPAPVVFERIIADDPEAGPKSDYRYAPEPAIYSGVRPYPESAAILGAGNAVGELWMVPVRVAPIRWNPATRSYRVIRRLVLQVDFVPATDREAALRMPGRPGSDTDSWRRIQSRLVLNHASAQRFPRRPRDIPRAPGARRLLDGNPEFRISVTQSGWVSVSHATLAGAGFPPGIAIAKIGVWERGYNDAGDSATASPIPVMARDANSNGTFDAGDAIAFNFRSLRDRVGVGSIENRYSDANAAWLTWTSADALVPGTIDGTNPAPTPATPTWFYDVARLEQDNLILSAPDQFSASPPENIPYLFWTNGRSELSVEDFSTTLPLVDAEPAGAPTRFRARYQGQTGSTHRLGIFFQGSAGPPDTLANGFIFVGQEVFLLDTGFTVPSSHIGAGVNTYRHEGTRQGPGSSAFIGGSAAWLDVIEATYPRRFVARSNYLKFNSGTTAAVCELTVTGFTNANVEIHDVTNPTVAARVTGVLVSPSGGGFQAVFRCDASGGARSFVAFAAGGEPSIPAGQVAADTPSVLRVPSVFTTGKLARSIVITPSAFAVPAARLADYRRSKGYVVEVADVQDIYDEFNGGIKSPHAIRRYLRHAYLTWTTPPLYVVLAGDASMDHKASLPTSGADWIPTYLKFEEIFGPQGRELVANDSYYSLGLEHVVPLDGDLAPRLALGRVPSSSAAELDQFVTKLIQYETFLPTETWRGKQLLVSDDRYSSSIFFSAAYCDQPAEQAFADANQAIENLTETNSATADIETEQFRLATYTDPLGVPCPSAQGATCRDIGCVQEGLRGTTNGAQAFQNRVAGGALILNVQAHANRYLIAHELIFCGPRFCRYSGDVADIANVNRPSFLMVWGCHANQFADGPLGDGSLDSTDAIGELWFNLPDRGAIASLGSSAYEVLETNAAYNQLVAKAFYGTPPSVIDAGGSRRARWILGEVLMQAAVENASTSFLQQVMTRTINLLGDPMTQMDALPPRVFEVTLDGNAVAPGASLTSDSPTDSLALQVKVRDEEAVTRLVMAERDLATNTTTPLDSTRFTVVFSDTSRQAVLTGNVRPRVGNYDLLVQATDYSGRVQEFPLAVRTPIRYFANGVEIIDGVFVESSALLRAEVTSPVPLTADSLTLLLDGIAISGAATSLDATGRRWAMESLAGDRGPGQRRLQLAIGGRTAGLDDATFQISSQFTLRGVAVVDPRRQGAGCGGSIFQYELSAPATRVEIQFYTVSGRRVASIQLPGAAGLNVFCWDGRDSQGHDTANGVYLFRLRATDPTGRTADHDGRMIRTR